MANKTKSSPPPTAPGAKPEWLDHFESLPLVVRSSVIYAAWQLVTKRSVAVIDAIRDGHDVYRVRVKRGHGAVHVCKSYNEAIIHSQRERVNRLVQECAELKANNAVDVEVLQAINKNDEARAKHIAQGVTQSMVEKRKAKRDANTARLSELSGQYHEQAKILAAMEVNPDSYDFAVLDVCDFVIGGRPTSAVQLPTDPIEPDPTEEEADAVL